MRGGGPIPVPYLMEKPEEQQNNGKMMSVLNENTGEIYKKYSAKRISKRPIEIQTGEIHKI